MKKILHKYIYAFYLLFAITAFSQDRKQLRADKDYEHFAYIDAIKLYERLAEKGHENPKLYQRLGDANYFNGQLKEANSWYRKLFELTKELPSEYFYRYAQTLKAVEDYQKADKILEIFATKELADQRSKLILENRDYLEQIAANSGRYDLTILNINSAYADFGSMVYDDKLIFASARDTGSVVKRIHRWTNQPFTSLYQAEIKGNGHYGKVKKFATSTQSKFNESTPTFTADGNTMFFTRNNYNKGVRGRDADGTTLLKIYRSDKKGNQWSKAVELPFNGDHFSTAHPALTSDDKWLYFASDRQGGQGQSDLYRVAILNDGKFGPPINLGSEINTGGRESFPFITAENELYFSSDGHPGLGGLDIFAVKILTDGTFGKVKNIGAPANTAADDFGFVINNTTKRGFLSSNRSKGYGNDDIYAVYETRSLVLDCLQTIKGMVYEKKSTERVAQVKVRLLDRDFKVLAEVFTDEKGLYQFDDLTCGTRYRVNASIEEYNTAEVTVDLPNQEGITQVDFGLEKTKIKVVKGDDLFNVLELLPIYFDFNKFDIRADATVELVKIVEVLEQYPLMKIDIRSHTDSRGNDAYNYKLSGQRAHATRDWIVKQGIYPSRVTAKGYGETQLINHCSNGVKCSDEQHQENRRSEFIVTEL